MSSCRCRGNPIVRTVSYLRLVRQTSQRVAGGGLWRADPDTEGP